MGVKGKDLVKYLERNGWVVKRITGSHHIMWNPEADRSVPVPVHGGSDVPPGTLREVLRGAGLPDPRTISRKGKRK